MEAQLISDLNTLGLLMMAACILPFAAALPFAVVSYARYLKGER